MDAFDTQTEALAVLLKKANAGDALAYR